MSYSISLNYSGIAESTPAISLAKSTLHPHPRPQPVADARKLEQTEQDNLAPSSFRNAWVQSIRSEINEGTFETPGRIDGTVERLLDILA